MPLDPVPPSSQKQGKIRSKGLAGIVIGVGVVSAILVGGFAIKAFTGMAAVKVSDLPNPRARQSFVVDRAGVIRPQIHQINSALAQVAEKTGTEVIVVTVPRTDTSPKTFVERAYAEWGLGQTRGGSVIMLLVMGKRHLEWQTDARAQRNGATYNRLTQVFQVSMRPALRAGNPTQAVMNGVREVAGVLSAGGAVSTMPRYVSYHRSYRVGGWSMGASVLYLILIFGGLIVLGSFGWGTCYAFGWGWYGPSYGYYGGWGYGPGVYMDGGVYVDGGGYVDGGYGDGGYDGGGGSSDCSSDCGGGDW